MRAEDPARRFADLKGRGFVFSDSLSLTGYIYPISKLSAMGCTPGSFFSKIGFSHSHDRSIAMVMDGSTAAAAVDSSVFMTWREHHPAEARTIRILERSELYPAPPLVVRGSLPFQEKETLRQAFMDLANSGEGKQILKTIGWTGFRNPDADYARQMEKLRRLFEKLRDQNSLPA